MRGVHRVASGTEAARRMNNKAKTVIANPSQEVLEWNQRVEEAKQAKLRRKLERKTK